MAVAFPAAVRTASLPASRDLHRRANWLLAGASAAAVLALLGMCEVFARSVAHADASGPEAMRLLHVRSDVYGWAPRPGFTGLIDGQRTTINRDGQRGDERAPARPGQRRVLVLGDSIAFGWGVHDEETYAAQLALDPRFSVVNLAVEGYGPDQSLLRLETEGLAYAPEVVVLSLCVANDLVDAMLPAFLYDGVTPKPFYRMEGEVLRLHDAHLRRPLEQRAADALQERFALLRWLRRAPPEAPSAAGPHWTETAGAVRAHPEPALRLGLALIRRMAAVAQGRGAEFLLLVHPNRRSFRGEDALGAALLRPGRLDGIRVVDLRERYRSRGLAFGDVALDALGHLSPRGHRDVADLLSELL